MKIRPLIKAFFLCIIIMTSFSASVFIKPSVQARNHSQLQKTKRSLQRSTLFPVKNDDYWIQEENESEPIFWDLPDNATINYNPVVLSLNHYFWDYLEIYNTSEEYFLEISANDKLVFDSYANGSDYDNYWFYPYEWNVSSYPSGTPVDITVFFYQGNNHSINHTASINVNIDLQDISPTIDLDDFKINLFHWPGTYYSGGYYPYFDPSGPNPYYHLTIYSDGLCELKFAEQSLQESHDYSSEEAKELMQRLQALRVFDLKDAYYFPSYDYFECSTYQIYIDSRSVQEWRESQESYDYRTLEFPLFPTQFSKVIDAILNDMSQLYFKPKRWPWEIAFWIAGGSVGGLACIFMAVYVFVFRRRR
ncbi:MAG: hypothetical protein GF308_14205 [Candidatus Heimdallarchaeota archaeon]|nr:hypothetical protein [Candidatus Heimdallarchaeota archaeon]